MLESDQQHGLPDIEGLEGRNRLGVRYTWLYPNATFAAGNDSVWMYEAYPLAADRTRVGMTICFPRATADRDDFDAQVERYYERLDFAIDEDIVALVNHQQGLSSPYARQGRFSAYLEPNVSNFAGWYAQRVLAFSEPDAMMR